MDLSYLTLAVVAIALAGFAALASWSIRVFLRYNKVSAKNNSISSGRDTIITRTHDSDVPRDD